MWTIAYQNNNVIQTNKKDIEWMLEGSWFDLWIRGRIYCMHVKGSNEEVILYWGEENRAEFDSHSELSKHSHTKYVAPLLLNLSNMTH